MRTTWKSAVTYLTILALVVWFAPMGAFASESGGRLEGLIIGTDGRAATGSTIHLIDQQGDVRQATTDDDGLYSFGDLPTGSYAVGIELPDGTIAPIASPPVRMRAGELARRDVKLLEADAGAVEQAAAANYSFGTWWAGLSGGAKAGVIIGFVLVGYGLVEAFSDDDDTNLYDSQESQ